MDSKTLACGCRVEVERDALGRAVGTIRDKGADCSRADHAPGHVVIMPGREHAAPPRGIGDTNPAPGRGPGEAG